jgi:hypothetical protein
MKTNTAPLAYVYDGRECLGHVLSRGKSVGIFGTQHQAANALLVREGGQS